MTVVKFLPDYAEREDKTGVMIQKVGVRGVYVKRLWNDSTVLTRQSAYVSLSKRKKGIHMSRLVDILLSWECEPIECDDELLEELGGTHNEKFAYWTCNWNEIKDLEGPRFTVNMELEGKYTRKETKWYFTIVVPYASVCPCSLEMVKKNRKGVPHMQRSVAKITVRLKKNSETLENIVDSMIIDIVEEMKLVPWGIMKREDELNWCVAAEKNALFVEDASRRLALLANQWEWIDDWVIVVDHSESIHEHNAVAITSKGVELR